MSVFSRSSPLSKGMSPWRGNEVYLNSKSHFVSSSVVLKKNKKKQKKKKQHQQVCVGKRLQGRKCFCWCSPAEYWALQSPSHNPENKVFVLLWIVRETQLNLPLAAAAPSFMPLEYPRIFAFLISDIKTVPLPFVAHILAFTWLIELIHYFAFLFFLSAPKKFFF